MDNTSFFTSNSVSSNRIIYTPSTFARSSLIHLQETGTLQAIHPHKNERSGLSSCLFFTVLRGSGQLTYDGETYVLHSGDCVFIGCKKPYSREMGNSTNQEAVRYNRHNKLIRQTQQVIIMNSGSSSGLISTALTWALSTANIKNEVGNWYSGQNSFQLTMPS